MKGRPKVVPFLFGYIQNSIYIYVMNIYQFSWTDMSGGFNQECNIQASNKLKAKQIFIKKVNKRISIKEWPRYIHVVSLSSMYKASYLKRMKLKIHFYES